MGLEDEARKRRERLKALRKAKEDGGPPPKTLHEDQEEELPNPKLKLRNYQAQDSNLQTKELEKPLPVHVDDKIQEQLNAAKPAPAVDGDIDIINLAPKKVDWDLKRAIQGKLNKLEKRTQKAIAELIRERLKEHNGDTAEIIDAVKVI